MAATASLHVSVFVRLWRLLPFVAARLPAPPQNEGSSHTSVETLSAARLRDLGFHADQVGGNIDFAKGEHYRHF